VGNRLGQKFGKEDDGKEALKVDEASAAGRLVADGHRHFHCQQHACQGRAAQTTLRVQIHACKDSGQKCAQTHAQARRMHTNT
jgi:hypothetical protein